MDDRTTNRDRLPDGKFAPGNKLGPGNPQAAKIQLYRKAIWDAVSTDDVAAVMRSMVDAAVNDSDVAAAKVVLERCAGQPPKDMSETTDELVDGIAARIRAAIDEARRLQAADNGIDASIDLGEEDPSA
jgi:lysozyme family protein